MERRRVTAGRSLKGVKLDGDQIVSSSPLPTQTPNQPAGGVTVASSRFEPRRGETFRSVALPSDVVSTGYRPAMSDAVSAGLLLR